MTGHGEKGTTDRRITDARIRRTDPAPGLAAKESDQQAKSSYSREHVISQDSS